MKLTIDNYEVNITVKHKRNSKASKKDAINLLNWLSILAGEASTRYNTTGCYALAERADRTNKEIYDYLDSLGAYKNL